MKAAILILFSTIFSVNLFSQNFSWAQSWGADGYDIGLAVTTDPEGNVYTTGAFSGTVDFDRGQGVENLTATEQDIFITKTDRYGNLIWVKQLGGSNSEGPSDIKVSAAGDVYVAGTFQGSVDFNPGTGTFWLDGANGRSFVCKLDADGNFVWTKQFSGSNFIRTLTLDSDNNIYAAGNFYGLSDFDTGTGEMILDGGLNSLFITKLDENGNYIWAKLFGKGDGDVPVVSILDIAVDGDGNVYTTGGFNDTIDFDPGSGIHELFPKDMDAFISKLDVNGDFVWVKQFGSTQFERGISLVLDGDANIYTLGSFTGTVDLDPGTGTSTLTSEFYVDHDVVNLYISKFDTDGNFHWTKGMIGVGDIIGQEIALDDNDEIFLGGYFSRTVDLDPGAGQRIVTAAGTLNYEEDIFIAKLDNSGNLLWGERIGSGNHDRLNSLTVSADNSLYICGAFENTVDFNPGTATWELAESNPASETYDVFLAKFSDCTPTQSTASIDAPCNSPYIWPVNGETYPVSGSYYQVIANAAGCDSIITLDLEIPVLEVYFNNVDGTLIYANAQPGETYQWINCSLGADIPGATASSYTPTASGNYALLVSNGNCEASSPCAPFEFVGLNENQITNLHLYPNPVQDEFTITADNGSQLLVVEVTTVNGQLVYSILNPAGKFPVHDWQTGIYIVKVVTESGTQAFRLLKN